MASHRVRHTKKGEGENASESARPARTTDEGTRKDGSRSPG